MTQLHKTASSCGARVFLSLQELKILFSCLTEGMFPQQIKSITDLDQELSKGAGQRVLRARKIYEHICSVEAEQTVQTKEPDHVPGRVTEVPSDPVPDWFGPTS